MNFHVLWLLSGMYLEVGFFFLYFSVSTYVALLIGSTLSSMFSFWRGSTTSLIRMNCYNMLQIMVGIHCSIMRFITPGKGFTMLAEVKLSLFLIDGIFFIILHNSLLTFMLPVFCTTYNYSSELFHHSSSSSMKYTS